MVLTLGVFRQKRGWTQQQTAVFFVVVVGERSILCEFRWEDYDYTRHISLGEEKRY